MNDWVKESGVVIQIKDVSFQKDICMWRMFGFLNKSLKGQIIIKNSLRVIVSKKKKNTYKIDKTTELPLNAVFQFYLFGFTIIQSIDRIF